MKYSPRFWCYALQSETKKGLAKRHQQLNHIFEIINLIFESTITCPNCGFQKLETMPEDSCQFFYECTNCKTILKPKAGDCCVFCSYGTKNCPPVQQGIDCCKN